MTAGGALAWAAVWSAELLVEEETASPLAPPRHRAAT